MDRIGFFPHFCPSAVSTLEDSSGTSLFVGQTDSGKLHVVDENDCGYVVATAATSFAVTSTFLIFTTSAHESTYVPLSALPTLLQPSDDNDPPPPKHPVWEQRRVERGSRIVVAVPSAMSLVLQMPRGNLETINPRPLVMAVVREDLRKQVLIRLEKHSLLILRFSGQYRKAFLACRKHRIDSNVIVEFDQQAFLDNVNVFVEQVHEVDYINLFLTNLGSVHFAGMVCV